MPEIAKTCKDRRLNIQVQRFRKVLTIRLLTWNPVCLLICKDPIMKKLLVLATVIGLVVLAEPGKAQVRIQANINIQPQWGPTGYDYAEYYYMPDIDVYYNIPRRQFVYLNAGRWVFAASLPPIYRDYDLYRGYKVVINDPAPYRRCDYYRQQYRPYRGYYDRQVIIRDARPYRYDRDRDYRRDYDRDRRYDRDDRRWDRDEHHDHGRHRGWDHDRD